MENNVETETENCKFDKEKFDEYDKSNNHCVDRKRQSNEKSGISCVCEENKTEYGTALLNIVNEFATPIIKSHKKRKKKPEDTFDNFSKTDSSSSHSFSFEVYEDLNSTDDSLKQKKIKGEEKSLPKGIDNLSKSIDLNLNNSIKDKEISVNTDSKPKKQRNRVVISVDIRVLEQKGLGNKSVTIEKSESVGQSSRKLLNIEDYIMEETEASEKIKLKKRKRKTEENELSHTEMNEKLNKKQIGDCSMDSKQDSDLCNDPVIIKKSEKRHRDKSSDSLEEYLAKKHKKHKKMDVENFTTMEHDMQEIELIDSHMHGDSHKKHKKKHLAEGEVINNSSMLDDFPVAQENIDLIIKKSKKRHKDKLSDSLEEYSPKKHKKHKQQMNIENFTTMEHDMQQIELTDSHMQGNSHKKHKKKKKHSSKDEIINNGSMLEDFPVAQENVGLIIKKSKKKKHKDKFNESSEEYSSEKHKQKDINGEMYRDSHKKHKKKKKDFIMDDSCMSEDFPISQENADSFVLTEKIKKKKHKKRKHEALTECNFEDTTKEKSEGGEELSFKKKSKKKHKDESYQEESYHKENVFCEDGVDDFLNKKSKKKKKKSKKRTHEEDISECNNEDKKKKKHIKEESNSIDESEEINNENKKSKSKDHDKENRQFNGRFEEHQKDDEEEITKEKLSKLALKKLIKSGALKKREYYKRIPRRRTSVFVEKMDKNPKRDVKDEASTSLEDIDSDVCFEELLDKVKNEAELSEEQMMNLGCINIDVPWPIPPLHTIETRIASGPTPEQKKQMEAYKVKLGIFTKAEDEKIKSNWEEFCRLHGFPLDPTPFLQFKHGNLVVMPTLERIKFVRFLAHGLDDRPLFNVYKRFQRLFNKIKTGRFTPQEDKIILEYMQKPTSSRHFADIAKILNRSNLAIEKRWKKLVSQNEIIYWEKDNIEEFIVNLLEVTGKSEVEDLKDRYITPREWGQLSKKLEISAAKLRRAWLCTIHPRIFIKNPVDIRTVKTELIDLLIENNVTDKRSINWDRIAKEFEGFTGERLNTLFSSMVSYHVPKEIITNLSETLQFLKNTVLSKKSFKKTTLKKLKIADLEF